MSPRLQLILGTALIEGVVLFALIFGGLELLHSFSKAELRDSARTTARLLAQSLQQTAAEPSAARSAALVILSSPEVAAVRIRIGEALLVEEGELAGGDSSLVQAPILGRDGVPGRVELILNLAAIDRQYQAARRWGIAAALLLTGATAVFSLLFWNGFRRRLLPLQRAVEALEPVEIRGNDELTEVARAFNRVCATHKNSSEGLQTALAECQAEAARLAGRQALQSQVLESALDAVISVDANGSVVGFNAAAEQTFGFTRSAAIGRPLTELIIPPKSREAHRQELDRYLKSGQADSIGKRLELDAWHRDGHTLPVEMTTVASHTADGVFFTFILRDLTQQREAERELRLAAHALEAPEAVLVAGPLGTILRVNRAFTRVTGYAAEEIVGKSPALLSGGELDTAAVQTITRQLNQSGAWEGEISCRHREGRVFPVRVCVGTVKDRSGEISHYVAHFSDITEPKRKAAELQEAYQQAQQASRAKSRFLASVSHEIRTPLNAIINMNALLADADLPADQRNLVQVARDSGKGLLGLIDNILEYSKMEAGAQRAAAQWFDLEELVQGVADLLYPQARAKGIEIACVIDPALGPRIESDPDMLRRILLNLVANAIKFTAEGGVLIRLMASGGQKEWPILQMQVEDTGIGILEQDRERIFQEFAQLDDSTTRKYCGVGLGLTISRRLAALLGGSIQVAAAGSGPGALFTVEIPVRSATESSPRLGQPPADLQVLLLGNNRVLEQGLREQLGFFGLSLTHLDALEQLRNAVVVEQGHLLLIVDWIDPDSDSAGLFHDIRNRLGSRLRVVRTLGHDADPIGNLEFDSVLRRPLFPQRLSPHLAWLSGVTEEKIDSNASPLGRSSARILLVEDSYPNQLLVITVLEREGYRVELAENGRQALDTLEKNDFDLILMDISMPVLDGLDATRSIRALDGPKSRIPIIALTAHAYGEDRARCLEAGMDDYLSKPVDIPNMLGCVGRWLEGVGERRKRPREEPQQTPPTAAALPDLDEVVLKKLAADTSDELVARVVGLFLQEAAERIPTFSPRLRSGEFETLRFDAHTLKGTSGACGALSLQSALQKLERAAKAADPIGAAAALESVLAAWERSEGRLRGYLSRIQGE